MVVMRWCVATLAIFGVLLAASPAFAQVELKNDGFVAGGQVGYQSGFCSGEAGASRFLAPEANRKLLKVRFLFGSTTDTKVVTIKVWDDSAGTDVAGMELFSADYQVTGSANGIVESDMTAENIIVPQQFRVGVVMKHMGLPSIARDGDNTIAADKNFILADAACNAGGPFTWFRSKTLGLTGDWVIRAEISATASTPPDAGPGGDSPDAQPFGDPCQSNAQCPVGEYCDLGALACTFECRTNDDCGGGTCNSLGQCIAGNGNDGGCGCRTTSPGTAGGWLVLGYVLVRRRRRSSCAP